MDAHTRLRDSLQVKVGVIFLLLALSFGVGSYAALRWLVFPAFTELEREAAVVNLDRVRQMFDAELVTLRDLGVEYSLWTMSHDFVRGNSQNFIEENIGYGLGEQIHAELMAFFNLEGELVWGDLVDPVSFESMPIDLAISSAVLNAQAFMAAQGIKQEITGLINTPSGLILAAALPILKTDGSGPIAGYFMIGRFVSEKRLTDFKKRVGVEFSLQPLPAGRAPQFLFDEREGAHFSTSSVTLDHTDQEVISTQVWRDVYGEESVFVDVRTPREITAVGSDIMKVAVVVIGGVGLLFVLFSWVWVRRLVVDPITRLKAHMIDMGKTGDLTLSIDLKRTGEIGTLVSPETFPKGKVVLELTESSVMTSTQSRIDWLVELQEMGVEIAIDDFGTGYSSLSYLKKLPIDYLKIDRSFVVDLEAGKDDQVIVSAIFLIAQTLGLKVVVEGVETPEQLRLVSEMGECLIQGYLYSRPLPANELEAFVENFGGSGMHQSFLSQLTARG